METQTVQEEQLVYIMRHLPEALQQALLKTAEQLQEEQEDEEDIRDALEALKEPSIPAEEVYKRLGL